MLPRAKLAVLTAAFLVLYGTMACSDDSPAGPNAAESGTISGYILNQRGGAVTDVNVSLSRSGSPMRATTTGVAGEFIFHNVEVGTWQVTYEVPSGYLLAPGLDQRDVFVTANQATVVPPLILSDQPVQLEMLNNGQIGEPGEHLPLPYWVAVSGTSGTSIGSVPIQWAVTSGGGSLEPVPDVASFQGMVHVLGPNLGPQTVTATATTMPGAPTVTFTTTAVSGIVSVLGCTGTTDSCRGVEAPAFSPATVDIAPGQTVGWRWTTEFVHNVVFEDDATEPVSSAAKDDGLHLRRFEEPMTVRYRCTFHSTSYTDGMVGTVIVK
jgi:plastocyanin